MISIQNRVFTRVFALTALAVVAFSFISTAQAAVISGDTASGENSAGWLFNRDTANQAPYSFSFDEASIGNGSLFVPAITNTVNGNSDKFIAELFVLDVVTNVTSISYDFLTLDEADAGHFYANVYMSFGESPMNKYYDCKYDVVPSTVSATGFTTVTFDPTLSYSVTTRGGAEASPYTCPAVPADMNALSSSTATIRAIAINVGDTSANDSGVSGYLDNIVVTAEDDSTTVYDFEPEPLPTCGDSAFDSFNTGSVNGQGGWSVAGPYDQEVVNNTYGYEAFGCKTLRISNAVTSGAFGDQTFAPELTDGAGETGVASNTRFEAQFDISSTMLDEQTGLSLSVSPDDGLGSRMSYLSFVDEAGGIRVTFYDVQGTSSPITFKTANLGLISRTPHTIKFVMDFVDGESNDIVMIYIDGELVHTGTSWENYYRYDAEQAGNGNQLSAVDTLIIRAGGTAVPAHSGNGFLFDNLSIATSLTPIVPVITPPTSGENRGGGGGGTRVTKKTTEAVTEIPSGQVLGATTTIAVEYYTFPVDFGIDAENLDVTNLQTILIKAGYLDIEAPTGYFGPLTQAALRLYQAAHGISATGYAGPLTRAQLNTEPMTTDIGQHILELLAQVALLRAQLEALKAQ